jgi:hypothetical protein
MSFEAITFAQKRRGTVTSDERRIAIVIKYDVNKLINRHP